MSGGESGWEQGVLEITGPESSSLVVSVPHHGEVIPQAVEEQLALPVAKAMEGVDEFSYELACLAAPWARIVKTNIARLVIDVNRSGTVSELDLTSGSQHERERLVRLHTSDGRPLWRSRLGEAPLTREELEKRICEYHQPYHDALEQAMDGSPRVLVDMHSVTWPSFDVVLGDFRGRSAGSGVCENGLKPFLEARGLTVGYAGPRDVDRFGRPVPHDAVRYSGGYITARYGDPAAGRHAFQVEVSRETCRRRLGQVREVFGEFFRALAAPGARCGSASFLLPRRDVSD